MDAFAALVKEHVARCEHSLVRISPKILYDDGPWLGIFRVINVKDTGNNVRQRFVDVHEQARAIAVSAKPVRQGPLQRNPCPFFVHWFESFQHLSIQRRIPHKQRPGLFRVKNYIDVRLWLCRGKASMERIDQFLHQIRWGSCQTPAIFGKVGGQRHIHTLHPSVVTSVRVLDAADLLEPSFHQLPPPLRIGDEVFEWPFLRSKRCDEQQYAYECVSIQFK